MLAMASPARPIGGSTQQEVPGSSDTDGELNAQVPHKRRKNLQNAAQYPSTSYVVSFSDEELDEKLAKTQADLKHWREVEPTWVRNRKKGQFEVVHCG